jgi:hypothetical protein
MVHKTEGGCFIGCPATPPSGPSFILIHSLQVYSHRCKPDCSVSSIICFSARYTELENRAVTPRQGTMRVQHNTTPADWCTQTKRMKTEHVKSVMIPSLEVCYLGLEVNLKAASPGGGESRGCLSRAPGRPGMFSWLHHHRRD